MNTPSDCSDRVRIDGFLLSAMRLPVLDVRSPGEYAKAHLPGAVNLPLFDDAGRAEIGTLYKQVGPEAAMLRALRHVGPRMEMLAQTALDLCARAAERNGAPCREVAVYCLRGGMRSASAAWLLQTVGLRAQVLEGGYKVFRRFVLEYLARPHALRVLGGKTGSGKTRVLEELARKGVPVLDLEGMARHRGSAFGALPEPQPSTEQFENRLAAALFRLQGQGPVWVEDESQNLGRVNIPRAFYRQLREGPLLVMEVSREARTARVLEEYAQFPREETAAALDRIRKRLGGSAHKRAHDCLAAGDVAGVAGILLDYYDRAYAKQLDGRNILGIIHAGAPSEAAEKIGRLFEEKGKTALRH